MKQFLLLPMFALLWACGGHTQGVSKDDSARLKNESGQGAAPEKNAGNIQDTTLEGIWVLQPVLASDTAAGKVPFINFSVQGGTFAGNTGCNSMRGSFLRHGDSLVFNQQVITTKMACQGYNEKAFLDNLFMVNSFKIEDGVLMLRNNQTVVSKWVRKLQGAKQEKV